MDEHPNWTPEQLEALETLRSKDDLENDPALVSSADASKKDPDLAQRLERVLQWDANLSAAMSDVPVPPALAEQILQAVEAASDQPSPAPKPSRSDRRRRRFSWVAIATGVGVAAVLVAIAIVGSRLPNMEPGRLRSIARERFEQNQTTEMVGSIVSESTPPGGFPYSPDLIEVPSTRWHRSPDFDRAKAVAYDIPLAPGQRATLYVVRCRSSALPASPPVSPQQTRNLVIAAWQGEGVVYVVVVQDNAGERPESVYQRLLKSTFRHLT